MNVEEFRNDITTRHMMQFQMPKVRDEAFHQPTIQPNRCLETLAVLFASSAVSTKKNVTEENHSRMR